MSIRIRTIPVILVLLAGSNAFAALNGDWKLQLDVTSPINCSFIDPSVPITQVGTAVSGTADLSPVGGCFPNNLTGTISGDVFSEPTEFVFFWGGPPGFFTINGAFTDPDHGNGTFDGIYFPPVGGGVPVLGTWTLTKNVANAVPASTPWGRVAIIVLAGLGALYFLRKRRMTVG